MSQQAASSSRSDKLNFRVFIKASEADGVEVKVNATSATNISELRNWLSKHVDLGPRLANAYPDNRWEILNPLSNRIHSDDIRTDLTLLLGKKEEPQRAPLNKVVRHQPHHNVMTEVANRFHEAGFTKPSRLLFCEFIDNAIEAYRRAGPSLQPSKAKPAKIEIHLVYKKGPYDSVLRSYNKLHSIIVLDYGPGMSEKQLGQWAEMAHSKAERSSALAEEVEMQGHSTCHADGQLGRFGQGSKAAGFVYGTDVRAVTSHEEGLESGSIYELLLSTDDFRDKQKNDKDWTYNKSESCNNARAHASALSLSLALPRVIVLTHSSLLLPLSCA